MAKVYLDTSFVSACVTTRSDPGSIVRRETSVEWMATQAARHKLFISTEVLDELDGDGFAGRNAAMRLVAAIPLLALTDQVFGVAQVLVGENVMPGPEDAGDAIHVSVAAVHKVDYLLSWNVRHLANPNKVRHLQVVCRRLGLLPPTIIIPDLLWEDQS